MRTLPALLLASVVISGVAHASPNELSLGSTNRTLRSDSANALTADSLGGGEVGYARRLDVELAPRLALWAEGAFGWGGADGTMFQTLATELSTLDVTAGARARYALRERVVATARLDLGMTRASLAIRDDAGHTARDAGWRPMARAALGVELYVIKRPRLSLGMRLELGYLTATPITLTGGPEPVDDDTLQLEMTAADLGGLELGGAVFAASIMTQF